MFDCCRNKNKSSIISSDLSSNTVKSPISSTNSQIMNHSSKINSVSSTVEITSKTNDQTLASDEIKVVDIDNKIKKDEIVIEKESVEATLPMSHQLSLPSEDELVDAMWINDGYSYNPLAFPQGQDSSESQPITPIEKGWKEVRVFVSSTFTDYFAEREILIKYVFPRLRIFCEERKILLTECDLRWGVPAKSSCETILRTCLDEIERCKELNINPFFINMLGDRYGWVPQPDDVPQSVAQEYNWIPGVSVTHMEILTAAYRTLNPNALFLIRASDYLSQIPSEFMPMYLEANPVSTKALKKLKEKIKAKFGPTQQVYDYTVSFKELDLSTGIPKIVFDGLEYIADLVYDFLVKAIARQYPHSTNGGMTISEILAVPHESFAKKSSQVVLGRDESISLITNMIAQNDDASSNLVIIYGGNGCGKSTVLSSTMNIVLRSQKASKVFFHTFQKESQIFIPVLPIDLTEYELMMRLSLELGDEETVTAMTALSDKPSEYVYIQSIKAITTKMFQQSKFSKDITVDKPALILIDHMSINSWNKCWLKNVIEKPSPLFRIIISSYEPLPYTSLQMVNNNSENSEVNEIILKQNTAHNLVLVQDFGAVDSEMFLIHALHHLQTEELKLISARTLARYNKRLDETQFNYLLNNPSSNDLNWLMLALEEIRVFGAFETVTQFIQNLPVSVNGLLELSLNRNEGLSNSYGDGKIAIYMRDTLLYILFSYSGLREDEIIDLLSKKNSPYPITSIKTEDTKSSSIDVENNDKFNGNNQVVLSEQLDVKNTNNNNDGMVNSVSNLLSRSRTRSIGNSDTIIPSISKEEWSIVMLFIKSFLNLSHEYEGKGYKRYTIKSESVREVIRLHYIPSEDKLLSYGMKSFSLQELTKKYSFAMADYFEQCSVESRFILEYPIQLIQAQDFKRLNKLRVTNDLHKLHYYTKNKVLESLRCKTMVKMPGGKTNVTYAMGESECFKCRMHNLQAYGNSLNSPTYMMSCLVCKGPIQLQNSIPAVLCRGCNFGNMKTCIYLTPE
eukprot:gene4574-6447_t